MGDMPCDAYEYPAITTRPREAPAEVCCCPGCYVLAYIGIYLGKYGSVADWKIRGPKVENHEKSKCIGYGSIFDIIIWLDVCL